MTCWRDAEHSVGGCAQGWVMCACVLEDVTHSPHPGFVAVTYCTPRPEE